MLVSCPSPLLCIPPASLSLLCASFLAIALRCGCQGIICGFDSYNSSNTVCCAGVGCQGGGRRRSGQPQVLPEDHYRSSRGCGRDRPEHQFFFFYIPQAPPVPCWQVSSRLLQWMRILSEDEPNFTAKVSTPSTYTFYCSLVGCFCAICKSALHNERAWIGDVFWRPYCSSSRVQIGPTKARRQSAPQAQLTARQQQPRSCTKSPDRRREANCNSNTRTRSKHVGTAQL